MDNSILNTIDVTYIKENQFTDHQIPQREFWYIDNIFISSSEVKYLNNLKAFLTKYYTTVR